MKRLIVGSVARKRTTIICCSTTGTRRIGVRNCGAIAITRASFSGAPVMKSASSARPKARKSRRNWCGLRTKKTERGQRPLDVEFRGLDEFPFTAGEFVWTGFDYLGEPTPYGGDSTKPLNFTDPSEQARMAQELKSSGKIKVPSRSSYFGIVDLDGFKKDRFYIYQAHWRSDFPMAHILPHWNWPERAGQITPVHVYTSGDEAELFLNGRSLGRKQKGTYEYRLRWDNVKYEPGELKVVAYKNGKHWAEDVMKTTGPASRLMMKADHATIKAHGQDLSFVTVT